MEKISCPIRVLWDPYMGPMGTRSSSVKILWHLYPVLQGLYGKVILSYRDPMGALSSSIRLLWNLYPVLHGPYGEIILSYIGPMGPL